MDFNGICADDFILRIKQLLYIMLLINRKHGDKLPIGVVLDYEAISLSGC